MERDERMRLAGELKATADALRHLVDRLHALNDSEEPLIHGKKDAAFVLVYGPAVAGAMEKVVRRLAKQK